jgi:hypothetical protein
MLSGVKTGFQESIDPGSLKGYYTLADTLSIMAGTSACVSFGKVIQHGQA